MGEFRISLAKTSHPCVVMAITQNPRASTTNNKVTISPAFLGIVVTQEIYNININCANSVYTGN